MAVVRMRILIIEENSTVANLMKSFLEQDGHEVLSIVHNGMAALQALNIYKPDLLLLDVHLPNHWAETIIHALRKKYNPMPRILVCAQTAHDARYILQRHSKIKCLLKPFTYASLTSAVLDEPENLPMFLQREQQLT